MEPTTSTNYTAVIIALIVVIIIGFLLGTLMTDDAISDVSTSQTLETSNAQNSEPAGEISGQVDSDLVTGNANEVAFTIQVDSLTPEQQTMLQMLGVDGESISITNGMVACAEADMGAGRVVQIQNGASITASEGVALVGCYTSND